LSDAALSPRSKPFVEPSNQKTQIAPRRADIIRRDRSIAPHAQKSRRNHITTLF
jgi:hypothetical protein